MQKDSFPKAENIIPKTIPRPRPSVSTTTFFCNDSIRLDFGLTDAVLEWIRTFLSDSTQQIAYNSQLAATQPLPFGVPQGSVLGPLLYVVYTAELGHLAYQHGMGFHQYADDSQVYISVPVSDAATRPYKESLSSLKRSTHGCLPADYG